MPFQRSAHPPRLPRAASSRGLARLALAAVVLAVMPASPVALARSASQSLPGISDADFWQFFVTMSESNGEFLSENFVSNEVAFQEVIPGLQRSLTPGGVFLGVGPEQNFTYIANLAPRMAVIFDIRRQNAMLHLMYKALFELSPTRAEFVARLFSRPAVARVAAGIAVEALFDSAAAAVPDDSARQANLASIVHQLTSTHAFGLSQEDLASIKHVYDVFAAAGPDVNYGYRPGMPAYVRTAYPTFGMLQSATNADSVRMAFLATEDLYRAVRTMQLRNLIIPVVGDFGGPKAIREVANYLHEHRMTVTAFYVSNVEQYLFRDGSAADRFYGNVASLPLDSTSMFIRSVPRMSGPFGGNLPAGMRFTVFRDSAGFTTITSRDSAGVTVTQTTRDTGRARPTTPQDTGLAAQLRGMMARRDSIQRASVTVYRSSGSAVMMGGLLTSGLASMQATMRAHFAGELTSYSTVIGMTRVGDRR